MVRGSKTIGGTCHDKVNFLISQSILDTIEKSIQISIYISFVYLHPKEVTIQIVFLFSGGFLLIRSKFLN